jgi:hypothetical protein
MRHLTRAAAALCALVLPLTTLGGTASAATPDDAAGGWLGRQLDHGLVHNKQFGFDDYGLTADVALALKATGGHARELRQVRRALAAHVDSWTTGVDFGSSDVYAGSVAKALVIAQATGAKPRSFGGVNLVRRLANRVATDAPIRGRLHDRSSDDFANTIGQSFAVRGLSRAGSARAGAALSFLLQQQCSAGYFRLNFADPSAARQGCNAGNRSTTSAPDTDVTALAVLNLHQLKHPNRATRAAITHAVAWLKRHQKANGSLGGGPATEASNSNSTGLAAWALGESGACRPARKAARWVKSLQLGGALKGTPLAGEGGAIAYDRAAKAAATKDGIRRADRDQWRRATAQAAPGLRYLELSACRNG